MEDYIPQVDDLDDTENYFLLAKQHAEADKLIRIGRTQKSEPVQKEVYETYRDFTPKFQPVPTPANADEKWYEMIARLQRLEERALHGD